MAPTCVASGLTGGKHCSRCGVVLKPQEVIPAKGHTDENRDFVCDVCGAKLCLDHKPQTIPGVAPTCTAGGLTEGTKCGDCGHIIALQREIPALGHDWAEADCQTPKTCTRCGHTEGNALGHHFGDWVTVKEPTETETGLAERSCARCEYKEQKELEKLEPAPTQPVQPTQPTEPALPTEPTAPPATAPTEPVTVPGTSAGDASAPTAPSPTGNAGDQQQPTAGNMLLWIVLILLLLIAAAVAVLLTKRKKKQ